MSHSHAVLLVQPVVYAAVRALLSRAGYEHAFHRDGDQELIDMHGITLQSVGGDAGQQIVVGSLLSGQTKEGRVEMAIDGVLTQMDLDKAREVVGMLQGAIEAAISDQLLFAFLTDRVHLSPESAAQALLDFREMRQGSRGVSWPM